MVFRKIPPSFCWCVNGRTAPGGGDCAKPWLDPKAIPAEVESFGLSARLHAGLVKGRAFWRERLVGSTTSSWAGDEALTTPDPSIGEVDVVALPIELNTVDESNFRLVGEGAGNLGDGDGPCFNCAGRRWLDLLRGYVGGRSDLGVAICRGVGVPFAIGVLP